MLVPLGQLWLPIVIAAIACHFVGFLVWVVLPHHRTDYSPLPDEASVRGLLRGKVTPGLYLFPYGTHKDYGTPEMIAKRNEGPNAFVTVIPNGVGDMMGQQVKNISFHLVVSLFVAYLAAVTLPAGTEYLKVFQVTGTAAFLAYGFSWGWQLIWFGKPWGVALKDACDGLLLALITAGIFGWRWPGM